MLLKYVVRNPLSDAGLVVDMPTGDDFAPYRKENQFYDMHNFFNYTSLITSQSKYEYDNTIIYHNAFHNLHETRQYQESSCRMD